ncbi:RNAse III [Desulfacinum hydrothermale DSM 13146]|uniref:Ribonuclease 3 n=1 Tax=Desulfacinum hydrothermale DSM 13146 TaxID=1121390 RepID=A0A1W1X0G4_9BACT|nr:ribonuclease III [Desulfacinum hydrothermale]SMC17442.1 RNAse III [Desulfacinum hydrothermale DSM 13146]
MATSIQKLAETLEYRFRNPSLLRQALVHRSFAHENPQAVSGDNERLEFLGDAVLSVTMAHLLVERFPDLNEGDLSRLRASLVNERRLAQVGRAMGLGDLLRLGKGEEQSGGRRKPSLIADAVEAVLGALYLDGGLEAAFRVVRKFLGPFLEEEAEASDPLRKLDKDFKTRLQEITQARFRRAPAYAVEGEEGPDHDKIFHVAVTLDEQVLARGSGRSKKAAEQDAARKALDALEDS